MLRAHLIWPFYHSEDKPLLFETNCDEWMERGMETEKAEVSQVVYRLSIY